jgi:non-heme chloroperoxidase
MIRDARLMIVSFALACASGSEVSRVRPHSTPSARMTRVAPGVALEVVDWGGHGSPLVFLAGGGNTAHVFDDFAPQFADSFHVIGITRRGFGASAGAPPAADLDTLVTDITATLDTLRLGRVILVGHSIAGEEMTRFAELHPDRCAGLVYIDAAYDRSNIDSIAKAQPAGPAPRVSPADTADFESIRAVYERIEGVREPDSEIRATVRFDSADRYLGEVTPNALKARLASGSRVARYDQVRCRALAIYAVPDSLADVVPYHAELDAAGRAQGDSVLRFVAAVVADSRMKFARFPQNTVVDLHGSNHYVFLQRPTQVARAMRSFLSTQRIVRQPDFPQPADPHDTINQHTRAAGRR